MNVITKPFILFFLFSLQAATGRIFGQAPVPGQTMGPKRHPITVLIPPVEEKAYAIAGGAFADMWQKVTGKSPEVHYMEKDERSLPDGDVVLIGSDAVNAAVHELIMSGSPDGLGIQYGPDNYRMLSLKKGGRTLLFLAGGNGRSTIYAVYDFFRKMAGVEYFWDGDVIPHSDDINIDGMDVYEKPRFEYRGLRYFAHRGLHRFQAEHWDLEDWKKEMDWLTKKRFNLFMLRTGIDDLFQRAFPDDVPYPPVDARDPDAQQRSYNDRTSFWQLRYRGELRKEVLQYARDRGLLHPEDVGTITHWYSHTPGSFYRSKPNFPVIKNQIRGYSLPTQAIWDINRQETWDAYWKLSETHIREFGGGCPRLFHTIGMAERTFSGSKRDNIQSKIYVYRKTQQMVHEHYPDVPLLVGTWDFQGWLWKNSDIQQLIDEFDPERTIILDYTADNTDRVSYRDWGLLHKFPWIFGIFHSYENNTDIHGDYNVLASRIKEAADDNECLGLVEWPEISHNDTYLLEYLADNSWAPKRLKISQATKRYCHSRYSEELAANMLPLWTSFLELSQSMQFNHTGRGLFREPQFNVLERKELIELTPEVLARWKSDFQRIYPGLKKAPGVLDGLADLAEGSYDNLLWRRDALDMARTIASRALYASLARGILAIKAWKEHKTGLSDVRKYSKLSRQILAALSDMLAQSDDFSMEASLRLLSKAKELNGIKPLLNPHTEQTLKGNAENAYCRSQQYELVEYEYRPELDAYWSWVFKNIKTGNTEQWNRSPELTREKKIIVDKFYATPLREMAPAGPRNAKTLSKSLTGLEKPVKKLLYEIENEQGS